MLDGPVIVSDVALAEVTVRTAGVFELMVPELVVVLAVMFVVPAETPRANPWVGVVVLMVATDGLDELQLTLPVMICVLLSL
jgi:hypothetical protein